MLYGLSFSEYYITELTSVIPQAEVMQYIGYIHRGLMGLGVELEVSPMMSLEALKLPVSMADIFLGLEGLVRVAARPDQSGLIIAAHGIELLLAFLNTNSQQNFVAYLDAYLRASSRPFNQGMVDELAVFSTRYALLAQDAYMAPLSEYAALVLTLLALHPEHAAFVPVRLLDLVRGFLPIFHNFPVEKSAMQALVQISESNAGRAAIVAAGGINLLAPLIWAEDLEIRAGAAGVFFNIVESEAGPVAVIAAGSGTAKDSLGIRVFSGLLESDHSEVRARAVRALVRIFLSHHGFEAIKVECGLLALQRMHDVLDVIEVGGDRAARVRRGIKTLLVLFQQDISPVLRHQLAVEFIKILGSTHGPLTIAQAGAVPVLAAYAIDCLRAEADDLVKHGTSLLVHLDISVLEPSVQGAFAKICLGLIDSYSSGIKKDGALALANFAQSDFGCRAIIEMGGVKRLLEFLAEAQSVIRSVRYEDDFDYGGRVAYLEGVLSVIIIMTQFDFGCAAIIKAAGIDVLKGLPSGYPFEGREAIALDNISRFCSKSASPATATMLLAVSGGLSSVAGAVAASEGPSCVGFR